MKAEIPDNQVQQARQRLPGIRPVGQGDWITVDGNYADQLSEKARLLRDAPDQVYQMRPAAEEAGQEVLAEVLGLLRSRRDFDVQGRHVICPDGRCVDVSAVVFAIHTTVVPLQKGAQESDTVGDG